MTPNAAYLLADLIQTYNLGTNDTPGYKRGFANINDLESWRRHNTAANLVQTVDFTMTALRTAGVTTDPFDPSLSSWYAAVHFAATPWGQGAGTNRTACEDVDIRMLRALGGLIDAHTNLDITEQDRRGLIDVLDEALELITQDTALPPEVRGYLEALLQRARMVIENVETYGPEAVRQVALELSGAMSLQADRVASAGDQPTARRWRTVATMLAIGFVGGTAEGVTGELGSQVVRQITER